MDKDRLNKLKGMAETVRVLYVEDNVEARMSTQVILENFFNNITLATNGAEGLDCLKDRDFDLILTDINMPVMDGLEMIRHIRETKNDIPILVMSAYNETDYFIETIKLGIEGYLIKPIDMEQFIDTFEKILTKIRLQRENRAYQEQLEEKVLERTRQVFHQFNHDQLTGMNNQTAMFQKIKEHPGGIAFLININGFKNYNELFGFEVGNAILQSFGSFLTDFCQGRVYEAYRIYGDTFALYTPATDKALEAYKADIEELINRLGAFTVAVEALDEVFDIEATVGVSIGEEHPLETSEVALYYAKNNKHRFDEYTHQHHATELIVNDMKWRKTIKQALSADGVIPVYQGIVDRDKNIKKYEVLMRLVTEEEGQRFLVTPYHFLDTAKRSGQYRQLTRMVIEKSFQQMASLPYEFSINLSFEDIKESACSEHLEELIRMYDVSDRLIFEIVESEYISDYEMVRVFIDRFKAMGVRIAIDDFGSGYSNFSHIFELRPDYVKIDGSLIKDIDVKKESLALVKAIVRFSEELGIKIIAEFVSSETIFNILYGLGIDEFQGYYFCQPSEKLPD